LLDAAPGVTTEPMVGFGSTIALAKRFRRR